eukprot:4402271-Prymnesium_polylepis.1
MAAQTSGEEAGRHLTLEVRAFAHFAPQFSGTAPGPPRLAAGAFRDWRLSDWRMWCAWRGRSFYGPRASIVSPKIVFSRSSGCKALPE